MEILEMVGERLGDRVDECDWKLRTSQLRTGKRIIPNVEADMKLSLDVLSSKMIRRGFEVDKVWKHHEVTVGERVSMLP